jgi:hypothetical protein
VSNVHDLSTCLLGGLFAATLAMPAHGQTSRGPLDERAESAPDPGTAPEADETATDWRVRWTASVTGQASAIGSEEDSDNRGGFLDRYDFTPNKGGSFPFEIGLSDAELDIFEDDAQRLLLRLQSPSSNLGITGSDIDDPFFNQRGLALIRLDDIQVDFHYHRMRTEELRVFPNQEGTALPFNDFTDDDDRFYRDRTGFRTELRFRPPGRPGSRNDRLERWAPEIALRGSYEDRAGERQLRFLLNPGNDWAAIGQNLNQEQSLLGAGLGLTPEGLFTLTVDFDHQWFRHDSATITDDDLPFASESRSIGFIPSTNRSTTTIRFHSRVAERAVVTGAFQFSQLEQKSGKTTAQLAAGLDAPEVLTYSGNITGSLTLSDQMSAGAWVKVVHRDNDLDRSTTLFNPSNGSQIDEHLESSTRVDAGIEGIYRPQRSIRISAGAKLLSVERDLEFAETGLGNFVILPENALVDDDSLSWELYAKTQLRPIRGLNVRGELGYQGAPKTGYIVELDKYVHGKLQASYQVPAPYSFDRPVLVSLIVKGGTGENRDFDLTRGLGPEPSGSSFAREFDRTHWTTGFTLDASPRDDVAFFASFYFSRDEQDTDLAISNLQRYTQETVPIGFRSPGDLVLQTDELSLVLGTRLRFSPETDCSLTYSFTRAESSYSESDGSRELDLIALNREVDANIHGLDLSLRHWLKPGLQLMIGYGFQLYDDDARLPISTGSVVAPVDRSTERHTATLGVTLNSDFFANP